MLRPVLASLASLAVLAVLAGPAAAQTQDNRWLGQRVMSFAHQGGEAEFPSNTMYAYRESLRLGADWLELDVNATSDGRLAVIHDRTLDRTTNATGAVAERTLAEIQALDAAYWFVPGRGAEDELHGLPPGQYRFRGVRTGQRAAPRGYTREDFRVPSIEEVLRAFPRVATTIEIKGDDETQVRTAELLAPIVARTGRRDVTVGAFNQDAVDRFHALAPSVGVAPGIDGMGRFILERQSPGPGVVAFQVPITYTLLGQPVTITTPDFVRRAHEAGYAVHVWLSNDREDDATYRRLLRMCVDAVMAARPTRFERILERLRVGAPNRDGFDPCGTRVRERRATARDGVVRLRLRRRGLSKERRSGTIRLYGIDRGGDTGEPMGTGRFVLESDRDDAVARVRLNRLGRAAVRGRVPFVMRAIVRERGLLASMRAVSVRRAAG